MTDEKQKLISNLEDLRKINPSLHKFISRQLEICEKYTFEQLENMESEIKWKLRQFNIIYEDSIQDILYRG